MMSKDLYHFLADADYTALDWIASQAVISQYCIVVGDELHRMQPQSMNPCDHML